MKRIFLLFLILLPLIVALSHASAQNPEPVPTLVPPTLVPVVEIGEIPVITESAVARIQETGRVRVGILYNAPPFGQLNIRNEKIGFDADLARTMAEAWGVEARFRQVTRQTASEMLRDDEIDILIAAQVHNRALDKTFEFSQTYHLGSQSLLLRKDDGAAVLDHMANRIIGVVIGTPSERAVAEWSARANIPVTVETFYTLDKAYGALLNSEIDGVLSSRHLLSAISLQLPEATKILAAPIELEPYAVVMRRGDISMRNLINRTLQYLQQTQKLAELGQLHFLEDAYKDVAVWDGVGEEAPKPADYSPGITYPAQFIVARLQTDRVLRVAGVSDTPAAEMTESQRRLETFRRAMIDAMATRWGVTVQYLVATPENAINLVANGQADLALGVTPNWTYADRVDFTDPYLLRGLRLIAPTKSNIIEIRNEIGGFYIAYPDNEPETVDVMTREGEQSGVLVRPYRTREQDIPLAMLDELNADAAMADIVKLIPHLEQYPDELQITQRWYTRTPEALALPRNDIDFRLLVEYTLQEMVRDGTLTSLLTPITLPDEMPQFEIWLGVGDTFGFKITR